MRTLNTLINVNLFVYLALIYITLSNAKDGNSSLLVNITNIKTDVIATNNSYKITDEVSVEGGGKISTHMKPTSLPTQSTNITQIKTSATPQLPSTHSNVTNSTTVIPIVQEHPKASNHKTISARKGVNFSETEQSHSIVRVNIKLKKPNVTVSSDEEPFAPSHFQSSKTNTSASISIPKVPTLDILDDNQQKTQKYIVPIIITILSVPFVAIIISILYKRGAEWWRYRHYRRMDFLINGIYDN